MDLNNKDITGKLNSFTKDFKEKVKLKVSDKFDLSIIGKIDLAEAEEVAKEEILFLTENDIMESLEDFELVPIKPRENFKNEIIQETEKQILTSNVDIEKTPDSPVNKPIDNLEIPLEQISEISEITEEIEIVIQDDIVTDIDEIIIQDDIVTDIDEIVIQDDVVTDIDEIVIQDDAVTDIDEVEIDNYNDIQTDHMIDSDVNKEVFHIDSDVDFVDNTIIGDDYKKNTGDDYFANRSTTSEILGLIPEENNYIKDKLFGDYYRKSDIILKSKGEPIEKNISSDDLALDGDISEIVVLLNDDYNADIDKAKATGEIKDESNESNLIDITDSIIILDDKKKLIELTSEFPEKHDHLVKLLSYLDGLFEKLPEDVIRKFAESEYFDLYSKVLKDMGL